MAQEDDSSLQQLALQCLVKIAQIFYFHMDGFIFPKLLSITIAAMRSPVNEMVLLGIEFWLSVCNQETDIATEVFISSLNLHRVATFTNREKICMFKR